MRKVKTDIKLVTAVTYLVSETDLHFDKVKEMLEIGYKLTSDEAQDLIFEVTESL